MHSRRDQDRSREATGRRAQALTVVTPPLPLGSGRVSATCPALVDDSAARARIIDGDAHRTGLPSNSCDLVHARTLLVNHPDPAVLADAPGGWPSPPSPWP